MASSLPAQRFFVLAVFFVSLLFSSPVVAQSTPGKQTAAKVLRLVKDANDEFDRGEYNDALELYQEAYDLYPDAVLLYRIGLSADKSGDSHRAVAAYQQFVDAAKSDDATAKKVSERIAELRASMPPQVTITTMPAGADVFVGSLDGEPLGQTPGDFAIPQGKTEILIRLTGYKLEKRSFVLSNGESETVDLELEELDRLAAPKDPSTPDDGGMSLGTWGWITTGAGVALLGTGVTFAVLTAGATDDVNSYDKRATGASREELEDLKSRASGLYTTSFGLLVAGGVVTTLGVSLVVIHALSKDDDATAIAPTVGFDEHGAWVGVGGRF